MLVVTEDDFRPFEYIQDGKPVGYDNELTYTVHPANIFQRRAVRSGPF
jgi:hypothetical protein